MTKTEILQKDAPVLRERALPVPVKNIESKKIQDILHRMKEALHAEEDGVAIAAPQIGESLRIFIVSGIYSAAKIVRKCEDKLIEFLKDYSLEKISSEDKENLFFKKKLKEG